MNAIEGEVRQNPDINWAKIARDPKTGDFYGEGLGITGIGIGSSLTRAVLDGSSVRFETRQIPGVEDSYTRVYVGKIDWNSRMIKVKFGSDSPINSEDTNRINRAASLAIQLAELEPSWRTSLRIGEISTAFEQQIQGLLPESDIDMLKSIAVAMDRLKAYVSRDYPVEFLRIADEMEALGVSNIEPGDFGEHIDYWTPEYLRKVFGKKEEIAV